MTNNDLPKYGICENCLALWKSQASDGGKCKRLPTHIYISYRRAHGCCMFIPNESNEINLLDDLVLPRKKST